MIDKAFFKDRIVQAKEARKEDLFTCPECLSPMKVKKGLYKRAHFYHFHPSSCFHASKSKEHKAIQEYLKRLIRGAQLEFPLKQIRRIADVIWPEVNIIFEVQCSAISLDHLMQRTKDYESLNYQVIWLFHLNRFNFKKINPHVRPFSNLTYYFTDMNRFQKGYFYDLIPDLNHYRQGPRIDLTMPKEASFTYKSLPKPLRDRIARKYYFKNDLIDLHQNGSFRYTPPSLKENIQPYFETFLTWLSK